MKTIELLKAKPTDSSDSAVDKTVDSVLSVPDSRDVSMVILAGGKSSRMGTDKCDLDFHGMTFLENQIEKGRRLGIRDILVSGYHGVRCSVPVIRDRFCERGPLGGLESCFRRAQNPKCLVLTVDVPLLEVSDLSGLIEASKKSDAAAVILKHSERLEPLIGVYRTELADGIAAYLDNGRGSVLGFLGPVGYEVYESRASEDCFGNINDPAAYKRLIKGR